MITYPKIYLPFLLLFLMISCNKTTPKEATETLKTENVVQTEDEYKSGEWLEELSSKTPLTFNQLEELVPKSLLGMPLVKVVDDSKNGMSAIKAKYSLEKEPDKESVLITFFILDGAGDEGYKHLKSTFNMLKFPTNKDDGTDILKIMDWENKRLLVRQRQVKEEWVSNLEFIKNLRFHLQIEGKKLSLEEIRESANILDQLKMPQ